MANLLREWNLCPQKYEPLSQRIRDEEESELGSGATGAWAQQSMELTKMWCKVMAEPLTAAIGIIVPPEYERLSDGRIAAFLLEHWAVFKLLPEAASKIIHYFGRDIRLSLKLVHDPEDVGVEPTLYAVIRTQCSPREAMAILRKFDNEWWLDVSQDLDAPFCITAI